MKFLLLYGSGWGMARSSTILSRMKTNDVGIIKASDDIIATTKAVDALEGLRALAGNGPSNPSLAVAWEHEKTVSPQPEMGLLVPSVVSPQPERVITVQPERITAVQPERITAVQPERITAVQPERITAVQPERISTVVQLQPSIATVTKATGPPPSRSQSVQIVNMMGNSKAGVSKQFGGAVGALGAMGAGAPAVDGSPNGLAGGGIDWTCSGITKTDFGWKCTEYARPK
jgi:hypothetical protein